MKQLYAIALAAAASAALMAPVDAHAADFREHRAIWMTPFLKDWPSAAITSGNASTHQKYLRTQLDKIKASGINVLYFHVRSHCDANYRSKYEPWSSFVGGTRGNEPAFDPLDFLLKEAHERGIEVYAWFNPYRYCGAYGNGQSELDYEYTHPEWLIVQQGKESILNPGLPEVRQRICDVIADVVDNYDVDGIVFDDYFYSNPTPMSLDADLYNAAVAADPGVGTQLQWRVSNINRMVAEVGAVIKQHKPYLPFGISPAGIASPAHVTSEYGLPSISGEWQYNAIASDPLYWYKHHLIDFMSPQIYWTTRFDEVQTWWNNAARKFGRHLYSSVTLSEAQTYGSEFDRELEFSRSILPENQNGFVYFRYDNYLNTVFRYEGKGVDFYDFMGTHSQAEPALTPLRPWNNVYAPVNVTGLSRNGDQLTWDAGPEGSRYTVYAFAPGQEQRAYNTNLVQVRYTNSFTIPASLAGYTFGVAVYDRYGNEYSMTTEGGAAAEAVVPVLTYPADGAAAAGLFDFTWQPTGCDCRIEVATDAAFTDIIAVNTTAESAFDAYSVGLLDESKTYYWRVRTHAANAPAGCSEVRSFTTSRVAVTSPSGNDATLTPEITWTEGFPGTVYRLEVSRTSDFKQVVFEDSTSACSSTVAPGTLFYGSRYYARVTAMRNGRTVQSDPVSFFTADGVPAIPTFVSPAASGVTLHKDQVIEVTPVDGASSMYIQVSPTEDFKTYYRCTLRPGEYSTPALSRARVGTKPLVDGQTYYVRVCARYFEQANQSSEKDTDYNVSTFVYSNTEGVEDASVDASTVAVSADGILSLPVSGCDVTVYAADGTCVFALSDAAAMVDLSAVAPGFYVVKVAGPASIRLKWIKR